MTGEQLPTHNLGTTLVPIDIERDAPHGVVWLEGNAGHETLRRMGVADANNHASTLEQERSRLQKIIADKNELAWMIQQDGQIVGIVEVHFDSFENIPGPNVAIMIGDSAFRGHGIGTEVIRAVQTYLYESQKVNKLFARHLTDNTASAAMLRGLGFIDSGPIYQDSNGLQWQNMVGDPPIVSRKTMELLSATR